jgi:hypothetical protein
MNATSFLCILVLVSTAANSCDFIFGHGFGFFHFPRAGFARYVFWIWTALLPLTAVLQLLGLLGFIYAGTIGLGWVIFLHGYSINVRHQPMKSPT